MSYRIEYDAQNSPRYPTNNRKHPTVLPWLSIIIIASFVVLSLYSQSARSLLRELLIPGNSRTTIAALEVFTENIKEGMDTKSAIETFCREILTHEELQQEN